MTELFKNLGVVMTLAAASCGASGDPSACQDADDVANAIASEAERDGLPATGICIGTQEELADRLVETDRFDRDAASKRASEYLNNCRRYQELAAKCKGE